MSEKICYYSITREASPLDLFTSWTLLSSDYIESCESTGVSTIAPTTLLLPCPQNQISVGIDACNEAFCCDEGRVSGLSLLLLSEAPYRLYGIA